MGSSAGKERVSAGEFTTVDMGMETMPMIKPACDFWRGGIAPTEP